MKKIYLISPNKLNKFFYNFLPKILDTKKVKFLQLRCKKYSRKNLTKHIIKILPITQKYKVKLIINDDAYLASKFERIGFHLGQKDLKKSKKKIHLKYIAKKNIIKRAKKLNTKIVAIGGVTNKNYKDLLKCGADYVAISSFVWKNKEFSPLEAIKLFK